MGGTGGCWGVRPCSGAGCPAYGSSGVVTDEVSQPDRSHTAESGWLPGQVWRRRTSMRSRVGREWQHDRHGHQGRAAHPAEGEPRRHAGEGRGLERVRHASTDDSDRHQPARHDQAPRGRRAGLLRRLVRSTATRHASVERGRHGLGGRRHVGHGRRVERLHTRPLRAGLRSQRRDDRGARPRHARDVCRTGHRPTRPWATCSYGSSRTPLTMRATQTSSAR